MDCPYCSYKETTSEKPIKEKLNTGEYHGIYVKTNHHCPQCHRGWTVREEAKPTKESK